MERKSAIRPGGPLTREIKADFPVARRGEEGGGNRAKSFWKPSGAAKWSQELSQPRPREIRDRPHLPLRTVSLNMPQLPSTQREILGSHQAEMTSGLAALLQHCIPGVSTVLTLSS